MPPAPAIVDLGRAVTLSPGRPWLRLVHSEALSAGLVPVAHPNDAFAWLAQRHPSIALCDFSDAEAAAGAIRSAYAQLENGEIARGAEDLSDYRWSTIAARYVAVYEGALAETGHGLTASAA